MNFVKSKTIFCMEGDSIYFLEKQDIFFLTDKANKVSCSYIIGDNFKLIINISMVINPKCGACQNYVESTAIDNGAVFDIDFINWPIGGDLKNPIEITTERQHILDSSGTKIYYNINMSGSPMTGEYRIILNIWSGKDE